VRRVNEPATKRNWLVLVGAALVLVVAAALVYVRLGVAHAYKVPAGSMLPTLAVGSHIAVSKLDKEPARGRVIVFHYPERPEQDFVKRIIGLPGDTIASNDTELLLNGKPIPRCRVGAWSYDEEGAPAHAGELWLEALDGSRWLVFHDTASPLPPGGPWTVAAGEVFVAGDNRENSHDSRSWFGGKGGGVPVGLIVGTAIGVGVPTLPRGAEGLKPALDSCLTTLPK
jgi:signal peptidase I